MKRVYLSIISVLLIILILFPIISYAVNLPEKNEQDVFFTADKTEVNLGDTVLLTLNLSKLEYENFKFELSSNSSLENISTNENVLAEIKNNTLSISGSKKNLSVQKINFSYFISAKYKIGDVIEIIGKVTNADDEENSIEQVITIKDIEKTEENNENDKTNEDTGNNSYQKDNQQTDKNEKQDNSDKKQEQNTQNVPQDKNQTQSGSQENSKMQSNTASSFNKTNNQTLANNNMQTNTKSTASQNTKSQIDTKNTTTKVETNTYKGESYNYLSKLKISGYDINPKFDKTNNTYFVTIDKDIENLNITAKAEASSATVTVYGNTNLKSGTNKILINVTAENGDVKTYRIYVTK